MASTPRKGPRCPRGPAQVGWQVFQGILATMGPQAGMAEMEPVVRRVRKEIQVRIKPLASSITDSSQVEEGFYNHKRAIVTD